MKKSWKRWISLLLIVLLMVGFTPSGILAEDANVGKEASNNSLVINSIEEIPVLSESPKIDNQVIVIYKSSGDSNIQSLSLSTNEVMAGEHVSDYIDVLELKPDVDRQAFIEKISENSTILAVDKNVTMELSELPNDPFVVNGHSWEFANIGADKTWNKVNNTTPIVVAVLDSGINADHPDLKDRVVEGYDYISKSAKMTDVLGHGTSVSGCIAAVSNNNIGTSGIVGSANVKIAPYRIGGITAEDNQMNLGYVCAALMAAADRSDIKVINMSFYTYESNFALSRAITYASKKGKILVACSGNGGGTENESGKSAYPASYNEVISVAATTKENERAIFSQYNENVDLCAPGKDLFLLSNTGGYKTGSGTSYSAPIVAGACATLAAAYPNFNPYEVLDIFQLTALDLGKSGCDDYYGAGLIQMDKALDLASKIDKNAPFDDFLIADLTANRQSDQNGKVKIQLVANAMGGKEPYQYKFYCNLGDSTTTIQDYSINNSIVFDPQNFGNYTFGVDVKDANGKTYTKIINNYQIVATENEYEYIDVDDGISIINYTGNSGTVDVPQSIAGKKVVELGEYAFADCAGLSSIIFPEGLKRIGKRALMNSPSLTEVSLPESLNMIDDEAFFGSLKLKTIVLPKNLEYIGNNPFGNCNSLEKISLESGNSKFTIVDGVLYDKDKTTLIACPGSAIKIEIPSSVKTIGNGGFFGCRKLENISLPNNLINIGDSGFECCEALSQIRLPETTTNIGDGAFSGCHSLTSIDIPDGVTSIEGYTFSSCNSLKFVSMPDSITKIKAGAFSDCDSLKNIDLPESVDSIEAYTFDSCNNLLTLNIPDGVSIIGCAALRGCLSLTSVNIPESVTIIDDSAFENCRSLTSVNLPGDLMSLGVEVFTACDKLETIQFNSKNTMIFDKENTIPSRTRIIGYDPSTAKDYAIKFNRTFEELMKEGSKNVVYRTHVENVGWQGWIGDGGMSGTSGRSLRLEGIEIKSNIENLGIQYTTHVQNVGWQNYVENGAMSGTSEKGLRLEAIKINLTGTEANNYDIYYRVHAQNFGWLDWAKNGIESGTAGFGYRLEGVKILVVPKGDPAPGAMTKPFVQQ